MALHMVAMLGSRSRSLLSLSLYCAHTTTMHSSVAMPALIVEPGTIGSHSTTATSYSSSQLATPPRFTQIPRPSFLHFSSPDTTHERLTTETTCSSSQRPFHNSPPPKRYHVVSTERLVSQYGSRLCPARCNKLSQAWLHSETA